MPRGSKVLTTIQDFIPDSDDLQLIFSYRLPVSPARRDNPIPKKEFVSKVVKDKIAGKAVRREVLIYN